MKLVKYIAVLMIGCPLVAIAQPKISTYHVPFYNVTVEAGEQISADYQFDPSHQVLVCTSTSLAAPILTWNANDAQYSAILPAGGHISLKANKYPEGFLVNTSGNIKIDNTNADGKNIQLLVSCEYHTWG